MSLKLLFGAYKVKGKCNEWAIIGKGGEHYTFPSVRRIWELGPKFIGKKFIGVKIEETLLTLFILPKVDRKKLQELADTIIAETK